MRHSFCFRITILFISLTLILNQHSSAQNSDAILTNQQTSLVVKNSRLYITRSYDIQINNKDGEDQAQISMPYSKLKKISGVEAYIKDNQGKLVKKLNLKDIITKSAISDISFYEDNFVKEFTLIHNVYPYTLHYQYQIQEDEFFWLAHWSPVIDRDIPTLNAVLTLDIPEDYKISVFSELPQSLKKDTIEKRLHYSWSASYLKQIDHEIYSPPFSELVPCVEIVPMHFKYDKEGSFENWKTYGNWEWRLMEGLNQLPEEETDKINNLIKGVTDTKEKIKILYHYLQDVTRYVNVTIDKGGMKPYPASYVAVNKYGDCKALSYYFKSVLEYAGIPSYYTDIYATDDAINKLNLNFPSQQFNHIILCVPIKNDTLWLDCTTKGPFNRLGTFTQNRYAFLVDKENSRFCKTPALSKKDVCCTRKAVITSDAFTGEVKVDFHRKYKGEKFELLSTMPNYANESEITQYIRNNFIESSYELIDYKINPVHRDSDYVYFDYSVKADNILKNYGNEKIFRVIPFSIPLFKEPKIRKLPVQIDYPMYQVDTLVYKIPENLAVTAISQNNSVVSPYGEYSFQFQVKDNQFTILKSFFLKPGNYALTEYKPFYDFIKKITDIDNTNYIVTKNK